MTRSCLPATAAGSCCRKADTLRSRLREVGIVYRHHLPRDQLLSEIHQAVHLDENGRAYGYRPVQAALANRRGVRATNTEILRIEHCVPDILFCMHSAETASAVDDVWTVLRLQVP